MKILLFGKNGQVGWELQRSLAPLGELTALQTHNATMCGDFTNPDGIAQTIQAIKPDVIVNAAAYTAVDKAESDAAAARVTNAQTPGVLAQEAKACNALLIHYSTDYVFDGSGDKQWKENDATSPLNIYGATKLEGEKLIRSAGCRHLIFRTSWVYASRGHNFIKTVLRLAKEREKFTIVGDQIGAPTGADLIADVTAHALRQTIQKPEKAGLYHLAAQGETSWCDYARLIIDIAHQAGVELKATPDSITPIPSRDYPTPAKRPYNSRLDTAKLRQTFDICMPDWQKGVTRMLAETI